MLYQKVRPISLDAIYGNKSVVKALQKSVECGNLSHVILLSGPTGCGKTTIARIISYALGVNKLDLQEINAANTRGIDTIRDIAKSCTLGALAGKHKLYIIDESHQITSAAQQALLKVLEDCPLHCYFIFCTTEPANIIKTIRNRCTEYALTPLGSREIKSLLKDVCVKEEIELSDDVIEAITYVSEGSPRAALVALEQVRDIVDEDEIVELLVKGTESDATIIDLCKLLVMEPALRQKRWKSIVDLYTSMTDEPEQIRRAILTFMMNKLKRCEDENYARDLGRMMRLFSISTFYGGKPALGSLIIQACFEG